MRWKEIENFGAPFIKKRFIKTAKGTTQSDESLFFFFFARYSPDINPLSVNQQLKYNQPGDPSSDLTTGDSSRPE